MSFDFFDEEWGDSDYAYSDWEEDMDEQYGEGNWEDYYGDECLEDFEENWSDHYDEDHEYEAGDHEFIQDAEEDNFFDNVTDFASENPHVMMMGAGAMAVPAMMAMKVYIFRQLKYHYSNEKCVNLQDRPRSLRLISFLFIST